MEDASWDLPEPPGRRVLSWGIPLAYNLLNGALLAAFLKAASTITHRDNGAGFAGLFALIFASWLSMIGVVVFIVGFFWSINLKSCGFKVKLGGCIGCGLITLFLSFLGYLAFDIVCNDDGGYCQHGRLDTIALFRPDLVRQRQQAEAMRKQEAVRRKQEAVRLAAEQGDAEAQYRLGELYFFGFQDHSQDVDLGIAWWWAAADQGNREAQAALYRKFVEGKDLPRVDELVAWLKRDAAESKKWLWAREYLGRLYEQGRGVPKDEREALFWYQLDGGSGSAYRAGMIWLEGRGVPQNVPKAAECFRQTGSYAKLEELQAGGLLDEQDKAKNCAVWRKESQRPYSSQTAVARLYRQYCVPE
ncbi:MAG: sel1 repeat family protein [Zoogloeaceae bacterium]|jgi:hypothetical protein|nr:sel1 repeat family protein [Zoogloeaceae bacterium]